jgi:hexosaminidase
VVKVFIAKFVVQTKHIMKVKNLLLFVMAVITCPTVVNAQNEADYNSVVPLPANIETTDKTPFVINSFTQVTFPAGNADMERNANFLVEYLKEVTGIQMNVTSEKAKKAIRLVLDKKIANEEGYSITVSPKEIVIAGSTPKGVFYGIQTIRKAVPEGDNLTEISMPTVKITDQPRFGYRGMMLDCGRHFFPISFVKKYIDMLALHNMNTFHWHLTEDQGWRIEIKKYPKLTTIGSKRARTVIGRNTGIFDDVPYGGFYTQDEAREIVKYAKDRYITVMPEIDMPGHMSGALASYPELGCTGGPYEVLQSWGVYQDILCAGKEQTFKFVEDVIDELLDIFPSKYFDIGGDEAPKSRWAKCPLCQQRIKDEGITASDGVSAEDKLQGYFTKRIEKYLNSKGRVLIGWDEILGCDVNQSSTIMSWRGAAPGAKAAKEGHDVVMSPTDFCYFDYYQTDKTWNEPMLIGGNLPIEKTYGYEPIDKSLTPEEAKHILGVQANLWTEYIGYPDLASYQVLPRMAAVSEVQWMQPDKKNFESFKVRSAKLAKIYDRYGWVYAKHIWAKDKK